MNTKGSTQESRLRLARAVEGMSDGEAMRFFDALAVERARRGERGLEAPIYPVEFLNAMNETGFKALEDWLIEQDAPRAVVELLADLNVLGAWKTDVEMGGGRVARHVNDILQETVASMARNVAGAGGVFYAPSGTTVRRGGGR